MHRIAVLLFMAWQNCSLAACDGCVDKRADALLLWHGKIAVLLFVMGC
ncbi:MAG: hypothetical protein NC400_07050 [Clostridium sp.]|nr:hypothetical protein [Clostridium sp.]